MKHLPTVVWEIPRCTNALKKWSKMIGWKAIRQKINLFGNCCVHVNQTFDLKIRCKQTPK